MDKLSIMSKRTVSSHLEARACEEGSSQSAPRAAPSGPNRVALRTCFGSDRPRQLSVESSSHTQKQKGKDHDNVVPQGLKHQNARAFPARDYDSPDTKKLSSEAHERAEDIGPARASPRWSERLARVSYDHSKQ